MDEREGGVSECTLIPRFPAVEGCLRRNISSRLGRQDSADEYRHLQGYTQNAHADALWQVGRVRHARAGGAGPDDGHMCFTSVVRGSETGGHTQNEPGDCNRLPPPSLSLQIQTVCLPSIPPVPAALRRASSKPEFPPFTSVKRRNRFLP